MSTSKFVSVNHVGYYSDEELKEFQDLPVDEYGLKILNVMYNRPVGISFCVLEAPSKEAVEKHHENVVLNTIGLPAFRPLLKGAILYCLLF